MPKQNILSLKCNIVLSCGKLLTESEWTSSPPVFTYENNTALVDAYAAQSDPNYKAKVKAEQNIAPARQLAKANQEIL